MSFKLFHKMHFDFYSISAGESHGEWKDTSNLQETRTICVDLLHRPAILKYKLYSTTVWKQQTDANYCRIPKTYDISLQARFYQ